MAIHRVFGQILLALLITGMAWIPPALADEPLHDLSVSGFAGFAVPMDTDITQLAPTRNENFTAKGVKLDSSGSYGAKLTAWTTALRAKNGFDVGIEFDHTRFSADTRAQTAGATGVQQGGIPVTSATLNKNEVGARIFAVNFLFRIPMGITENLPHGRWYPYLGIGGGAQRASMRLSDGSEDSNTALAVQSLAGVKIFLLKTVAIFTEYKFTYADHTFVFDTTRSEIIQAHHMTFGVALHF